MPDSKITALASIGTGTDPANDPLVIVDVSDVSPGGMSATGTTKKVTLNNLLASGPAATLSSATVTGAATVGTTLGVTGASTFTGAATFNGNTTLGDAQTDTSTINAQLTARQGEFPSAVRAAASDYAAVTFDGATSGTRITSTLTGQNIGTGDMSMWNRFRVFTTTGTTRYIASLSSSSTTSDQARACLLYINSIGGLVFYLYGATVSDFRYGTIAGFQTAYSGQVVDVVVTRTGATLKIYINGIDTAYSETTGGTPPAWSETITSTNLFIGQSTGTSNIFTGRIYRSVVFNRALSAGDVTELITVGVNPADQWGMQTAAYTSDFSAGADGWAAIRGTSDGNIDGISGVDNTLRFTVDGTASNTHYALRTSFPGLLASKRYRIGFNYFITAANATMNGLRLQQLTTSQNLTPIQSVTGAWTSITPVEFVSTETRLDVVAYAGANSTFTGNGTDTFYLHSIVLTRIGAIVDLDLGVGIGLFFPDRSDNRLGGDGFGGISHVMPREYGSITVVKDLLHSDISATAATTSLFSLPPNCGVMFVELDRVTAFDAGITVQIGVSGTAAKFLAATSVATTGITGANSASLISESNSANTSVFIQKSGATTTGRVRVRVTYQIRG